MHGMNELMPFWGKIVMYFVFKLLVHARIRPCTMHMEFNCVTHLEIITNFMRYKGKTMIKF